MGRRRTAQSKIGLRQDCPQLLRANSFEFFFDSNRSGRSVNSRRERVLPFRLKPASNNLIGLEFFCPRLYFPLARLSHS
jgi:hypothetical protein